MTTFPLLNSLISFFSLINTFSFQAFSENSRNASVLILDKSASTKYELNFSKEIEFNANEIEVLDGGNETIAKNGTVLIQKDKISATGRIIRYIKNNTDNEILKSLKFNKKQTIKYVLRALPNEISGGIATSLIFSAWNAAVYVNQISDEQIMNAERKKYYQKVVKDIVNKNKGLYFNNELFVIEKK